MEALDISKRSDDDEDVDKKDDDVRIALVKNTGAYRAEIVVLVTREREYKRWVIADSLAPRPF